MFATSRRNLISLSPCLPIILLLSTKVLIPLILPLPVYCHMVMSRPSANTGSLVVYCAIMIL